MLSTIIYDPRLLHERFLKACRNTTGPVVVVSDVTLFMNSPAAALTRADDRSWLWEWARQEVASSAEGAPAPRAVALVSGARPQLCEGIWMGQALVGAVVRLTVPACVQPPRSAARAEGQHVDWSELTQSQRLVAEHVAYGLTNRQTATMLSVSRHTVDYHLRHIFRKLQIHSRVELCTSGGGGGAADQLRDQLIATDIASAYRRGRRGLALTNRIEHVNQLAAGLKRHGIEV